MNSIETITDSKAGDVITKMDDVIHGATLFIQGDCQTEVCSPKMRGKVNHHDILAFSLAHIDPSVVTLQVGNVSLVDVEWTKDEGVTNAISRLVSYILLTADQFPV